MSHIACLCSWGFTHFPPKKSKSKGYRRSFSAPIPQGFTLLELLTVLLIVSIISVAAVNSAIPSASAQLQASRDALVTALYLGQQKAMMQNDAVQVNLSSSQIDIRQDTNNNGNFTDDASLSLGGLQYPVVLPPNQSASPGFFLFDRLGQTNAANVTLSLGADSVTVSVTSTGYIY